MIIMSTLMVAHSLIDTRVKCDKCNAINTITLENGELKKQVQSHS